MASVLSWGDGYCIMSVKVPTEMAIQRCVCVFVCSTLWSSPVSGEFAGKI